MSNDNNRIRISRRKALVGLGSIGLASAGAGIGTYAQFTDTEEAEVTFTAGGVDGKLTWNGSYNAQPLGDGTDVTHVSVDNNSGDPAGQVNVSIHFSDVKPGDYGCFNFGLQVENNPAWVASCVHIDSDTDHDTYEPEIEAGDVEGATPDYYGSAGPGELAENLYMLPYYDSDDTCVFFDPSGDEFTPPEDGDFTTASAFWSNSQPDGAQMSESFETEEGETYYLAPRSLRNVVNNVSAVDTAHWSNGEQTLTIENAPDGSEADTGCVMIDGDLNTGEDSSNNTQGVNPLDPGDETRFGYDWHVPFATGNEVQGDQVEVTLGFIFLQTRHTEAPNFGSYSPGSNTPN